MVSLTTVLATLNLYAFFVSFLTRSFKDDHGVKKGFVLSNIVISSAIILVLLFVYIY